jgi:hypothetical protein
MSKQKKHSIVKKKNKLTLALTREDCEKSLAELKQKDKYLAITTNSKGELVAVKQWDIGGFEIEPKSITASSSLSEEFRDKLKLKFEAVKAALRSNSEDVYKEAIDTILGDLITGAYQDKLTIYQIVPVEEFAGSIDALRRMQQLRQVADTHLLNLLNAVIEIKRPPVTVVVKQAEQVNVAQQINQGDKQVNIGNEQSVNVGKN